MQALIVSLFLKHNVYTYMRIHTHAAAYTQDQTIVVSPERGGGSSSDLSPAMLSAQMLCNGTCHDHILSSV